LEDDLPQRSRIISETAQPLGDALSIDSMLEGHELDSHAVRTQQIAKQVAELVDKNPENVSELIRRWISHSR
jgi:flagellar biosynthesis/type III secretory pathway M-ring protein FliF/YscJ